MERRRVQGSGKREGWEMRDGGSEGKEMGCAMLEERQRSAQRNRPRLEADDAWERQVEYTKEALRALWEPNLDESSELQPQVTPRLSARGFESGFAQLPMGMGLVRIEVECGCHSQAQKDAFVDPDADEDAHAVAHAHPHAHPHPHLRFCRIMPAITESDNSTLRARRPPCQCHAQTTTGQAPPPPGPPPPAASPLRATSLASLQASLSCLRTLERCRDLRLTLHRRRPSMRPTETRGCETGSAEDSTARLQTRTESTRRFWTQTRSMRHTSIPARTVILSTSRARTVREAARGFRDRRREVGLWMAAVSDLEWQGLALRALQSGRARLRGGWEQVRGD